MGRRSVVGPVGGGRFGESIGQVQVNGPAMDEGGKGGLEKASILKRRGWMHLI